MSVTTTRNPLEALPALAADVAARAGEVDAGRASVRPVLAELGAAGLLGLGLPTDRLPVGAPDGHGSLVDQAEVVRTLARGCTATAFSVWAHRTTTGYLAGWAGPRLRDEVLPDLLAGRRPAATAMATAFQAALGLREVDVTARPDGDGWVLDGGIPWASNLFDDALVVLAARTEEGRRLVVAVDVASDGFERRPAPDLLALDATASTSVRLAGVRVPAHHVLSDRFLDLCADVRPAFLLLQAAIALGIADTALEAAAPRLQGTLTTFADDHAALAGRLAALSARHAARAAAPGAADADLVQLRLEASEVAVAATRHESAVTGGAGYLATSPTARRLREAAFLPIQSPTEAQLRWELTRSA